MTWRPVPRPRPRLRLRRERRPSRRRASSRACPPARRACTGQTRGRETPRGAFVHGPSPPLLVPAVTPYPPSLPVAPRPRPSFIPLPLPPPPRTPKHPSPIQLRLCCSVGPALPPTPPHPTLAFDCTCTYHSQLHAGIPAAKHPTALAIPSCRPHDSSRFPPAKALDPIVVPSFVRGGTWRRSSPPHSGPSQPGKACCACCPAPPLPPSLPPQLALPVCLSRPVLQPMVPHCNAATTTISPA